MFVVDVEEGKLVLHFVDLAIMMIIDFDGSEIANGYKLQFFYIMHSLLVIIPIFLLGNGSLKKS